MRRAGVIVGVFWCLMALMAPWLAPYDPGMQHRGRAYAPPTPIRILTSEGSLTAPHYSPLAVISPLERRFVEDRSRRVPIAWFAGGRLFAPGDPDEPLLVLGADGLGRDVFSRVTYGARTSLLLAVVAAALAIGLGAAFGVLAGYFGGRIDAFLSRLSEFVLVLPALYVVVALRAVMPLVLTTQTVFLLIAIIFALVAWPSAARGVRAIVASERSRGYVEAARAAGARRRRILLHHLLPATSGFLWTQYALLVPACLIVEGTLSYAGLGFPEHTATWGTMLQDTGNIGALTGAPWLLAPALSIVTVVLAINLMLTSRAMPRAR